MTDLQTTLNAIDELAVHECGHCSKPLPADSESLDFCGPEHQSAWLAAKQEIVELVGYREPVDLPQHQANLVELHSPETTSPTGDLRGRTQSGPGGYITPSSLEALLAQVRPFARERLDHWVDARPERDEAAVERVRTGRWLARFAAPWHPRPMTVRSEYQGRPPEMLHAIRPAPMPIWTMEDPVAESMDFRPDVYRLESVNEHDRSAIYRIQGLRGPRRAIFIASDWQVPDWWMRDGWEGRCVEVEGDASGFRWAHPNGDRLIAEPTERYENLPGGVVAEVWEPRPDRAESAEVFRAEVFRAEMNRRRIMQEAMLRSPGPPDLQAFRRITGV